MKVLTYTKSLTALGFLLVTGIAGASTLTYTQTVTVAPAPTDISNGPAIFNLFGSGIAGLPAGATLTGVTLSETITETLSALTLTNNNTGTATARYTASANFDAGDTANASDGSSLDNALAANSGNNAVNIFTSGTKTFSAGQTISSFSGVPATLSESTGSIAGTTSSYVGSGSFALNFTTLSGFTVQGGGNNVQANQTTVAAMTATVVYTYTTPSGTPEPSTFVLLGGALVALGSLRSRRKKVA
jgi:hypothetical protein